MVITIKQVEALLRCMKKNQTSAEIDWTNRHIRVVSELKTHPTKVLSTGPMQYRHIIFELSSATENTF